MCGIVAYFGTRVAAPILLEGLKRLEYRGYDSAGVAVIQEGEIVCRKRAGRVSGLAASIPPDELRGVVGIAHTRWATHGAPTDENAHPHLDASGRIALVHNGIIENYTTLRIYLEGRGVEFQSETDTEVLVQLIGQLYQGDIALAVRLALRQVQGTYGLAVICADEPDKLVAARRSSTVLIGVADGEYIVSSGEQAIVQHTAKVVELQDGEMAVMGPDGIRTTTLDDLLVEKEVRELQLTLESIELGDHKHFMIKEILEQPEALANCLRGRVTLDATDICFGGLRSCVDELVRAERVVLVGCGTAWHACLVGSRLIEHYAQIVTTVDYASEFRYRNPPIDRHTAIVAVSQSGETADTLAALEEARDKGALTLAITNVVDSRIAREAKRGIYIHAGPEIGVASTKAYTGQVLALSLLALYLGRSRGLALIEFEAGLKALQRVPSQVARILWQEAVIRVVAEEFHTAENWLYLGRGYNYPTALEGALKLKEVSYIHAEGLPASEMKHGPIALITKAMPVVFIATQGSQYEKIISNINEVRARQGRVIAVATEGDERIAELAEHVFYVPDVPEPVQPLLTVVPLQLLAYHAAVLRGCDVDKPRSLAKSVTVE